jgi:hypothetical protein
MILPDPAAAFLWRRFDGRSGLVCAALWPLADHVFTTRDWPLGESSAGDADASWAAVADAVAVEPGRLWRARQVHGAAVTFGGPQFDGLLPEADIVIARETGHAAGVQMADCVPLLVVNRRTGAVAAVHAGWRGIAARAPEIAVRTLVDRRLASAADLLVAIGPSIGPCCYEVGQDVRCALEQAGFADASIARWLHPSPLASSSNPSMPEVARRPVPVDERWFLDTWTAASDQVVSAGVPAAQVFVSRLCTASHPAVFCSYRRDGRAAGRLAAAIRCAGRR